MLHLPPLKTCLDHLLQGRNIAEAEGILQIFRAGRGNDRTKVACWADMAFLHPCVAAPVVSDTALWSGWVS